MAKQSSATQGRHRPGPLKQSNKAFKSRHATKGSIKALARGRSGQATKVPSTAAQLSTAGGDSRLNRKNRAKQVQADKKAQVEASVKVFQGRDGAPRVISVIPMTNDISARSVVCGLLSSLFSTEEYMELAKGIPEEGLFEARIDRFKSNLQFIILPYRQLYRTLDAAKVSDTIILGLSDTVEVNDWGDTLLRCLQAQGFPDVHSCVVPSAEDTSNLHNIKKSLLSFTQYFNPSVEKVYSISAAQECQLLLRQLCSGVPRQVHWRQGRSWLVGQALSFQPSADPASNLGTLSIQGTLRGCPLTADRLIHIPAHGDFQIGSMTEQGTNNVLSMPTEEADDLVSQADPDDVANEQNAFSDEEMDFGNDDDTPTIPASDMPDAPPGTTPKRIKKVPKGTSSYQASWIIDDKEDDEEDLEEDEDGMDRADGDDDSGEESAEDEEFESVEVESRAPDDYSDLDDEEEEEQLQTYLEQKRKRDAALEADDLQWPDEIDTPLHIPARERFQRYRGLKSLRTSHWDPYENLPRDYGKIFQFENERVLTRKFSSPRSETDANIVAPGTKVVLHLINVPHAVYLNHVSTSAFPVFSLFEHEHKKSVINLQIQRNTEYHGIVKSKESVTMLLGPRRYQINPLYTQESTKARNNVHKYERYLRHGNTYIASTFGPVTWGKMPVIILKNNENGDAEAPHLVAMGTYWNADPTRIIAKRILLTGSAFKIHKKTATIRYMFFNPDDVRYYKPLQLQTRMGRIGHITMPLGTHGYFKAHFDGPITQMDTICLPLYKRCYPKWAADKTPEQADTTTVMQTI